MFYLEVQEKKFFKKDPICNVYTCSTQQGIVSAVCDPAQFPFQEQLTAVWSNSLNDWERKGQFSK